MTELEADTDMRPYAVLVDGSRVPLMNCPECKEMGRADMAHYHVCPDVKTAQEQAVLSAVEAYVSHWKRTTGEDEIGVNLRCDVIAAELARRESKT